MTRDAWPVGPGHVPEPEARQLFRDMFMAIQLAAGGGLSVTTAALESALWERHRLAVLRNCRGCAGGPKCDACDVDLFGL